MGNVKRFLSMLVLAASLCGCSFFSDETNGKVDYDSLVTAVKFSRSMLDVNVRESEYLQLSLSPAENQGKCHVSWEYDKDMVTVQGDNFGAVITGVTGGTTYIKAKCNGIIATCMITVISDGTEIVTDPYIYSNFSVVELQPGNTATISSSLYGGSVADMEFFEWNVKDPSVADIAPARNNCIITAKKPGSTQVFCTHPDSKYGYSFIVYVYTDKMTETYITTDQNIVTINKNDTASKNISVDLVNPISAAYKNGFSWNYADDESREIISLSANLNEASVTPLKNGIAKITVTHENSQYPLDLLIRVNTIVKNTYIGLSTSSLVLTDSETPGIVYATIENYDGFADNEKFTWDFPDKASDLMDWTVSGNSLRIMGKKNGVIKVKVSHELSEYSRSLLIILQNQIGSAIDSSMYITTTQNFVQTQVGKEPVTVMVSLVGGEDGTDNIGDENTNFSWWIDGGRNNSIIEVQDVTGVVRDLSSRSAVSSGKYCPASLKINPVGEGTAKIIVSHPRCLYDTEIQVKVYSETAIVNPLTISTDESLIKLVNGNEKAVTAELRNANPGDENKVKWTSSKEDKVSVAPDIGKTTVVKACGTGSGQTYITAHLDGALSDKKILVLTADTEQALEEMKWIVSDSTYLRVSGGESKEISVECHGFSTSDIISWTVSDSSLCTVESVPGSANRCTAKVTGLNDSSESKKATVTAGLPGSDIEPVVFDVTILPKGQSSEVFDESAGYLTTSQNTVVIENVGESASLSVTGVNISSEKMRLKTTWSMSDVNAVENEPVFELVGNSGSVTGDSATITAKKKGKSCITVKNKDSMNQLAINAKCGELYEWTDDYVVYITTDEDVVNIINGQTYTIGCALVNTTSNGSYLWQVTQGKDNVDITGLASGTCTVTGKQAGQSIITVSNTLAGEITKEILVNVANTEEELKGFKYLTTEQNVVTVGEKGNVTVSVSVKNADTNILSGFEWTSSNPNIATVEHSGCVAVVYGKSIGTAKITVRNRDYCEYPLEVICNVVDPIAASEDPYISCNNIVTCTVGSDSATVVAELIGGKKGDEQNFTWAIKDPSIATLYASNDTAQIKALKEGVTQVIVKYTANPNVAERTILVICEPKITTNCYISLTESIIKMSPSDDPRTITATLVNGEADDAYDFVWWADNYDKIDMNYTGNSCLIEPISSGTVTIHVSHPKAANQKDIILYISNYSDFAFSQPSVELVTGSTMFINMEVPATGVDCNIAYSSSNNNVCTVFGNNAVCTLQPGSVKPGESVTCKVSAVLQTKGGAKQAEAELLVSVTGKVETDPYITLSPDSLTTIITMNKGEKRNLKAVVHQKGKTDNDSLNAGLVWSINEDASKLISFVGKKNTGSNVQLEAIQSGKAVITISHNDKSLVKNPLSLYVIVPGTSDPTVTLSHEEISMYLGEEQMSIVAKVQNAEAKDIKWKFTNDDEPGKQLEFFTHSESGNKCSISPNKIGNGTITAYLDTGASAECKVHILKPAEIKLFVYDDDEKAEDARTKYYINSLQLMPGETKILHYETVPAKDRIKQLYKSDSSYFDVNDVGYKTTYSSKSKTYHYPEEVGTIIVTGRTNEGTAFLQTTSASNQKASVSITNSYSYLLTTNKSIISASPDDVVGKKTSLLEVSYEVRPAVAKIYVWNITHGLGAANLTLEEGSYATYNKSEQKWIITKHDSVDPSTGIAKGVLKFRVSGEVNSELEIFGLNENIVSSGNGNITSKEFGHTGLLMQVYYTKHTFTASVKGKVPTLVRSIAQCSSNSSDVGGFSIFDKNNNTFYLGDGEEMRLNLICNEKYVGSQNIIKSVEMNLSGASTTKDGTDDEKSQKDFVNAWKDESDNTVYLNHSQDYGLIYTNGNFFSHVYGIKKASDPSASRASVESFNDTVRETAFAGYLKVTYFDFKAGDYVGVFNFPVYVRVRNCPCIVTDYYQRAMSWE